MTLKAIDMNKMYLEGINAWSVKSQDFVITKVLFDNSYHFMIKSIFDPQYRSKW